MEQLHHLLVNYGADSAEVKAYFRLHQVYMQLFTLVLSTFRLFSVKYAIFIHAFTILLTRVSSFVVFHFVIFFRLFMFSPLMALGGLL